MDTLSLVLEYLKDLEECMDDGDLRVAKESKLFDALEHKSVVIEVGNQKFTILPRRHFGPLLMSALKESRGVNLAWIIADHLYKHASGMTKKELDEKNQYLLKETGIPTHAGIKSSEQRQEPRGLNSGYGDWNASLNEEHGNVWRDSMLIRNNYMLEHSMLIIHHLADQGGSYGLGDDDYFTSTMLDFRGNSSGYAVGGSSRGAGLDDEDMDENF
nr:hypothetical protein [Tanacetum cinerariifolium]